MLRSTFVTRFAPTVLFLNKGKVISWLSNRGFGFIEDEADSKQHFVHFSALDTEPGAYKALTVGQEVEYEVVSQDGRTRAEKVTGPGGAKLPSGPRAEGGRGRGFGGGGRGGYRGNGRGRGNNNDNFNRNQNNDDFDGFN